MQDAPGNLLFPQEVNVEDFGATGDGVTDDSEAVLAAINAAGPNQVVLIPDGTWKLSVSLPNKAVTVFRSPEKGVYLGSPTSPFIANRQFIGSTYTGKSKKASKAMSSAAEVEAPDYPYGLCLRLEKDRISALASASPQMATR